MSREYATKGDFVFAAIMILVITVVFYVGSIIERAKIKDLERRIEAIEKKQEASHEQRREKTTASHAADLPR